MNKMIKYAAITFAVYFVYKSYKAAQAAKANITAHAAATDAAIEQASGPVSGDWEQDQRAYGNSWANYTN
jgi:hypothetical protein